MGDEETERPPERVSSRTDKIVEAWFTEHFHGTAVSRDTDTYNQVYFAVAELKRRLNEEVK